MCQLKSCLVLKDRVYCPDYDSHQDMLDKLGIKDDYLGASKTFVRVELTPPDGVRWPMEPLDRWTLKVDQDVTPDWWDEEADRPRVEEAVEEWRREHVFAEGEHVVKDGKVYAFGSATVEAHNNATVTAWGSATVTACDSAMVKACGSARVTAYGSATVKACDSAMVKACDSAMVKACGSARVTAYGSARVKAHNSATVEACDSATVEAHNSATVKAFDSATVEAHNSARVEACDSATVEAWDGAIGVYPQKNKIVYPAGWTAETHD